MTENNEDISVRIRKGIKFLRMFDNKANSDFYKKSVNRFLDLVEAEMFNKEAENTFK